MRKLEILNNKLKELMDRFPLNTVSENYFKSINLFYKYAIAINDLKKNHSKEEIVAQLTFLRNAIANNNLAERLQKWPEGYEGDYKTIEMICNNNTNTEENTLENFIDKWAFGLPIAQQHRNKVALQSAKILETIEHKMNPKILIVGAGSGLDVRNIQNLIAHKNFEIYFNDMDNNAINFIKQKLNKSILNKCKFVNKNILNYLRSLNTANTKFDLILFGGVFDYLTDKQIKFVLSNCYKSILKNDGNLFFTNIAENNEYKNIIEYFTDWCLIERTENELKSLCLKSFIGKNEITIYKENTGLTYIVDIIKQTQKNGSKNSLNTLKSQMQISAVKDSILV